MKQLLTTLLVVSLAALYGCAGSPVHTSSMGLNEISRVDDYTLCKAYTPREHYNPSAIVIYEVRRRGLNCATIYQYVPLPTIEVPQGLYTNRVNPRQNSQVTCFKSREWTSGLIRNCAYNCMGSEAVQSVAAGQLCPLSIAR